MDDNAEPLSIVVPILIYHGSVEWDKKRLFDYFEPFLPEVLLKFIPKDEYVVIDIQAMSDSQIEEAVNLGELRAAFIALKHGHDGEYFKKNMKKVLKFVKSIPTKELLEMYYQMLLEYIQRRSEMENEAFNNMVEQSNEEEMATTFKTIFETAREEAFEQGVGQGIELGIEQGVELGSEKTIQAFFLINSTSKSDAVIAKELNTSEEFVKKIRQKLNSNTQQ